MAYPNVPAMIGAVVSSGRATLHELDTVYGTQDLHDLMEIAAVDAHNRRLLSKKAEDR
jgi:hypothetical protein